MSQSIIKRSAMAEQIGNFTLNASFSTPTTWYPPQLIKRNGICILHGVATGKYVQVNQEDILLTIDSESFRSPQNTMIGIVVGETMLDCLLSFTGQVYLRGIAGNSSFPYDISNKAIYFNAMWKARS